MRSYQFILIFILLVLFACKKGTVHINSDPSGVYIGYTHATSHSYMHDLFTSKINIDSLDTTYVDTISVVKTKDSVVVRTKFATYYPSKFKYDSSNIYTYYDLGTGISDVDSVVINPALNTIHIMTYHYAGLTYYQENYNQFNGKR